MWFNTTQLPSEAAMLFSKGRSHFELHVGSPPFSNSGIRFLPRFLGPTTGEHWDAQTAGVTVNQWKHVVAIYEGTSSAVRLYLDGIALPLTHLTGPDSDDVKVPARIGMRYDGIVPFSGRIDSLRIYNRVLTLNEIRALQSVAD
jgi:hypothetical protein